MDTITFDQADAMLTSALARTGRSGVDAAVCNDISALGDVFLHAFSEVLPAAVVTRADSAEFEVVYAHGARFVLGIRSVFDALDAGDAGDLVAARNEVVTRMLAIVEGLQSILESQSDPRTWPVSQFPDGNRAPGRQPLMRVLQGSNSALSE